MVKVCIVKSCPSGRKRRNKKGAATSVSFFRPSSTIKLQRWSQSLAINLKVSDYVCQYHFKEEHIKSYQEVKIGNGVFWILSERKTLKEEALPTVNHQSQINLEPPRPQKVALQAQKSISPPQTPCLKQLQKLQEEHKKLKEQINIDNDSSKEKMQLSDSFQSLKTVKHAIEKYSFLPAYWFYSDKPNGLEFLRIDPASKRIINRIHLNEDFSIKVVCANKKEVPLGDKVATFHDINKYLKLVEKKPLCVGTEIEKKKFSNECKGLLIGDETHKRFQANPRCKPCQVLRNQLLIRCAKVKTSSENSIKLTGKTGNLKKKQCKRSKKVC